MAVSAVSAIQSTYYTAAASVGGQTASAESAASTSDYFELSSASGGGGSTSSTCPKSNSTCIGCGSCETTSSVSSSDSGSSLFQPVNYATLQALSAYENASKYV